MSIGINDVFGFGKHKGKTFAEVMLLPEGSGYCAWLREEKKRSGQPQAFNAEANKVIDEAIRNSKSLRKKYSPWDLNAVDLETILKDRQEQEEKSMVEQAMLFEQRKAGYSQDWASW